MWEEVYRCTVLILVGVVFACCIPISRDIGVAISNWWDKRK